MAAELEDAPWATSGGGLPDAPWAASRAPDMGRASALAEGVKTGASAGLNDEIVGAYHASGVPQMLQNLDPNARASVLGSLLSSIYGAGKMGYEALTGQRGEATEAYEQARDEARGVQKTAKEQYPGTYLTGELAGGVGAMAALPAGAVAQGTRLATRIVPAIKSGAQVGAEYGALSGFGEGHGLGDSAAGAVGGALSGAVGGALGGAGGELIGAGGKLALDYFGRPIAAVARGLRNPDEEALRRGAGAIMEGQPNVVAGKSPGLTPREWLEAKQRGEPVMLADMGGETGRALARSAANTDPEARALITSATHDRFAGQSERLGQMVRGLTPGGADAFKRSEQILAEYERMRQPLYRAAYQSGDRSIWSPELERLVGIPAVADAMKSAVTTGANRAGAEGYGAFNPGITITPDGHLLFKQGPRGIPTYPNLQFWDYAYRDLRDAAGRAFRAGEKGHGSALASLADHMRTELDKIVPQYGAARGVAARYFGGENAIEAGAAAVKFKGDARELQARLVKIKDPRERALFEEGYVSELANRLENVPDRNDVTKRIFQSPQDRKRIEAVIGPDRTRVLQAALDRETIYDTLRTALGNSTTARQLIEAGLAGGAIGGYLGGGDPRTIAEGIAGGIAGGGLGVTAGLRHGVGSMTRAGAQRMIGYVDRNTARKVAEFLTSDDPQKLMRGLEMVRKNSRISAGLRDITDRVSVASGAQALPAPPVPRITVHPQYLQGPSSAGADENQEGIPRPPSQ